MKVALFTDTLGDLNGVSRFIQDMGELAYNREAGNADPMTLQIVTSTSKPLPDAPYVVNLPYRFKLAMPFYQELDLVLPKRSDICDYLRQNRPDLVHISTPGPFGWQAKNCAQALGLPLVGTYHTDFPAYLYDLSGSNWVKRRTDHMMARFYRPFEYVFSRSLAYLEVMANDIDIAYARSGALFPGTNLQRFHPQFADRAVWPQFGLSPERLKVLYVGRMNIEKNLPFLVETWQAFLAAHPDIHADLIMVGEGRYRKWTDKLRPHHAYFLGPLQGEVLSKVYASADLFVFPSVTDTLGQVIMEAQASGLGCLVSDVGGPQSLVVDGQTGRVLQANDRPLWVEGLYDALSDADLRQRWKVAAREHMLQYNIADSFEQFLSIHQHLYRSIQTGHDASTHAVSQPVADNSAQR